VNLCDYDLTDGVATITMDDGKANALSPVLLAAIGAALDRAQDDEPIAVVLAGRPGRFSAGFDLGVLAAGGPEAIGMLRSGFELAHRLLSFPSPVVIACTGHAIAMGSFLLCAADHRIGAAGDFRLHANEAAIGLVVPSPAVALLRAKLTPSAFDRAVTLAESTAPADAVERGWLDEVVAPDDVVPRGQAVAASFSVLDRGAHVGTKLRTRATLLADIRRGIEEDYGT
jgi:enoyl-CoA hydratase